MNNINKVINHLLEIPINFRAKRELYKMSSELNIEVTYLKEILDKLVADNILNEKIEYKCDECNSTEILDKTDLKELLEESDTKDRFECMECFDLINPETNKTGYIYYDVINYDSLKGVLNNE